MHTNTSNMMINTTNDADKKFASTQPSIWQNNYNNKISNSNTNSVDERECRQVHDDLMVCYENDKASAASVSSLPVRYSV